MTIFPICILLFILSHISFVYSNNYYLVPFINNINYDGQLLFSANVGSPPQQLTLKFITSSNIIWIANSVYYKKGFNPYKSKTLKKITNPYHLHYQNKDIICSLVYENISLHNEIFANKIMLYLAENGDIGNGLYDGVFGVGLSKDDDNFKSFLDILISESNLNNKVFAVSNEGIVFGNIVSYLSKNTHYHDDNNKQFLIKYINLIINQENLINKKYQITLSLIYVKFKESSKMFYNVNNYYPFRDLNNGNFNDNIITIRLGSNVILAPLEYFNFIKKEVFGVLIERNICFETIENKLTFIACNSITIDNYKHFLPILNFIIGKRNIKLNLSKLFRNSDDSRYILFEIMHNDSDEYKHGWVFGTPILKEYIIIFNNDDNTMAFEKNKL
jgi:hypothetical protein